MAEYVMSSAEKASMQKGQLNENKKNCKEKGEEASDLVLSEEQLTWFRDAKVGLFVHWGIYSLIGKGEWTYFNDKFTEEEYRKIGMEQFHPNQKPEMIAQEWTDTAVQAGAKYMVMVARHHDGFSLWDSKGSYKSFTSEKSAAHADYVRAYTDSCHQRGLRIGLYYSPMDWRFPGYFDPYGYRENALEMKKQCYDQVEELCTEYGKIDILWYDGGWLAHSGTDADAAWFWDPLSLCRMARKYQPGILMTPRSGYKGDFLCDEGTREVNGDIIESPWEKCMSVSTAWGYQPNDHYQSTEFLIQMLVNVVCRGGNLLLNVGPDPDGHIPEPARTALNGFGEWLAENGDAIYGTRGGPWQPKDHVFGTTSKGDTIYIHVLDCEKFQKIKLPLNVLPSDCSIIKATILNEMELKAECCQGMLVIAIPQEITMQKRSDTIIKLLCK